MATVRKPAAERQRDIVEITLQLRPELGEGSLSTQTIADQTGITQAALFRHFPTKNDLWISVLTEIERRARRSWEEACRECDPAVARLRISEELHTAARECDRLIPIRTGDMESLPMGTLHDCVLRWSLTGRADDLVAEGDRLIGLQLRLSGLQREGDRS